MIQETKIKLKEQYNQMWESNSEKVGCVLVGIAFIVFTGLWFGIV